MTPDPNPVSAAGAAGSGDIDCWVAIGTSDKPTARKYQAQNLVRLVPRPPPPRPRRIEIRITAVRGREPIGRTRALQLTECDLAALLEAAVRMERAP